MQDHGRESFAAEFQEEPRRVDQTNEDERLLERDQNQQERLDESDETNAAPEVFPQAQALLMHRPSFVPPLPVASSPGDRTPTMQAPLTNHEVYELIQQKNQQVAGAALHNNAGNMMSSGQQATNMKHTKRQSLYIHQQSRGLERQASVIVGTPGFRERYGE